MIVLQVIATTEEATPSFISNKTTLGYATITTVLNKSKNGFKAEMRDIFSSPPKNIDLDKRTDANYNLRENY